MFLGQNFMFGGQKYYFLPFLFDTFARKVLLYLYIFIMGELLGATFQTLNLNKSA